MACEQLNYEFFGGELKNYFSLKTLVRSSYQNTYTNFPIFAQNHLQQLFSKPKQLLNMRKAELNLNLVLDTLWLITYANVSRPAGAELDAVQVQRVVQSLTSQTHTQRVTAPGAPEVRPFGVSVAVCDACRAASCWQTQREP